MFAPTTVWCPGPAECRRTTEATDPSCSAVSAFIVSVLPPLHDRDLLVGQPIRVTHQRVDACIGGLDPALVELLARGRGAVGRRFRGPTFVATAMLGQRP
jgi:hypothetical protein